MAFYLTEADVEQVLTTDLALTAVEDSFREQGLGAATNVPRVRLRAPRTLPPGMVGVRAGGSIMNLLSAVLPGMGVVGYKAYMVTRTGVRFQIFLYSLDTGEMLGLIEANQIGQQRTGAASGVATKYLARADAATLGVIGTGFQAEAQVQAVCAVRSITQVLVHGRNAERRDAFARKMAERVGVSVTGVATAEEAVRQADVVCTITSSRDPVLLGEWLPQGCHINAAGSNSLLRREIDDEVVRRASRVVVDDVQQAKNEAGDLEGLVERGIITWAQVRPLGEIVAGRGPGRTSADEITLFESLGLAIWDLATAARVFEAARSRGLGQQLPF